MVTLSIMILSSLLRRLELILTVQIRRYGVISGFNLSTMILSLLMRKLNFVVTVRIRRYIVISGLADTEGAQ
jgi:hypothetical protein